MEISYPTMLPICKTHCMNTLQPQLTTLGSNAVSGCTDQIRASTTLCRQSGAILTPSQTLSETHKPNVALRHPNVKDQPGTRGYSTFFRISLKLINSSVAVPTPQVVSYHRGSHWPAKFVNYIDNPAFFLLSEGGNTICRSCEVTMANMAGNQGFLRPLLYPGNPAASSPTSHASTYRRPVPRSGTYGTMNMASSQDVEKRPLVVTVEKEELMPRSLKEARKRRVFLSVMWLFASVFVTGFVLHVLGIPSCQISTFHEQPSPNSTPNGKYAHHVERPETTNSLKSQPRERQIQASVTTSSAAAERTVLRNFEVAPPVLMPYGPADSDGTTPIPAGSTQKACTVLLMRRDFAFSYGDPYIGKLDHI